MRMTSLFGRRAREKTSDTETASHDLLLRAGYIRQHASGIFTFLTPGLKSLRRIERIVREEMEAAGAQEILMSVVQSAEPWKATGRYASIDETLVRFRDRHGRDMVLGMTHEEIVAELAATEIASYRQAGVVVYQIQTKFRDELRPRAGLLRTREFVMKDAYSLSVDRAGLELAYASQAKAYLRIFERVGLRDVRIVRSGTGDMGGDLAHEFSVLHESGEDTVGVCGSCGDVVNVELLGGRVASAGESGTAEACARCGGVRALRRAIEVGNIFQLGTRYTDALDARAADRTGRHVPLVMGSYGIGISRLLATLVEQHHDERGIALPAAVSPFDVHVLAAGSDGAAAVAAAELYASLQRTGRETLYDDRDLRTGEKFADADLIGAALRVVTGAKSLAIGRVEIRERATGALHEVSIEDACDGVVRVLDAVRRRESAGGRGGALDTASRAHDPFRPD